MLKHLPYTLVPTHTSCHMLIYRCLNEPSGELSLLNTFVQINTFVGSPLVKIIFVNCFHFVSLCFVFMIPSNVSKLGNWIHVPLLDKVMLRNQ